MFCYSTTLNVNPQQRIGDDIPCIRKVAGSHTLLFHMYVLIYFFRQDLEFNTLNLTLVSDGHF